MNVRECYSRALEQGTLLVAVNRWGIVRSAITISAIILMEEGGKTETGPDRLEPNVVVAVGRAGPMSSEENADFCT